MPGRNSFKALPIFIALIILSVFSITFFQSFSVDSDSNNVEIYDLKDTAFPFPVYPNSTTLSQTESESRNYYTFRSNSGITTTQQWYQNELIKDGWTPSENQDFFSKGNEKLELSILDNDDKSTLVIINYIK